MSNIQHHDQAPHEDISAHVDEPSTPPAQDASVSNTTATTQAPATVWDPPVHQAMIPEPPPLENLGPVIEVDERYLGPNPASYFTPDSPPGSQTTVGDTHSTLTQEHPTDVQIRIPDGRVVWVSRRALGMSARTGMAIMPPVVPEDDEEDASAASSRGDDINQILWADRTFIPHTPTHTPAITSPNNSTTQVGDGVIPDINLDVANDNLNRIDENPREEFYIIPSSYGVPKDYLALARGRRIPYAEYIMQERRAIDRLSAALRDRIHLAFPNPRNLPTFEFIMRVPYELGRQPVIVDVTLPNPNNAATDTNDRMLIFGVSEETEIVDKTGFPTQTQPPALDQSLRTRRYIQQLPRLDQVDVPEV